MNAREARILALENRLLRLPVLDLERRARAAEETQLVLWASNPTPPTILDVLVQDGGTSAAIAGATVELCDDTTRDPLGITATTDALGHAVFALSGGATRTVGVVAVGYQAGTATGVVVATGATTTHTFNLTSGALSLPDTTRTLIDPVYGTTALPWSNDSGGIHTWTKTVTVNYAGGCGSCSAVTGIAIVYTLTYNPGAPTPSALSVSYTRVSTSNNCPALSGVNRTLSPTLATTTLPELHFTPSAGFVPLYCAGASAGTFVVK